MHRGRALGGNAGKRKAKLTDATFHAVLGSPVQAAGKAPVATQETTVVEHVEVVDVALERAIIIEATDAGPGVRVAVAEGPVVRERRPFCCQDHDFGYAECPSCHNDQVYYVPHAALAAGFSFRCRVCRGSVTAWPKV